MPDLSGFMVFQIPACYDCQYYLGGPRGNARCQAYPEGIPRRWIRGGVIHDTVQDDQIGNYIHKATFDE